MPTQKWSWELSALAVRDIREILAWTSRKFGPSQMEGYRSVIYRALRDLRNGPSVAGVRTREDVGKGLMLLHVAREGRRGRHFILFRVASDSTREIEVLRILHDQMDLEQHIPRTE